MSKKNAETAVLFIMDTLLTFVIDSSFSTTEFHPNPEYAVITKD
jgi:hypothetical protein